MQAELCRQRRITRITANVAQRENGKHYGATTGRAGHWCTVPARRITLDALGASTAPYGGS